MKPSILPILIFLFAACNNRSLNQPAVHLKVPTNDSVLANDQDFINRSVLKGKFLVKLSQYDTSSTKFCLPDKLSARQMTEEFEGFRNVGDIDNDNREDFVFVLAPINRCEEGQSYYFSNPGIPRISTDSNCCHPESIFSIGDIDEDGRNELGEYYSSCASRYKAITIWTLKEGKWKEVETFSYVLNNEYKVLKDFNSMSLKISKGTFKFLEIKDVDINGRLVAKWRTVRM